MKVVNKFERALNEACQFHGVYLVGNRTVCGIFSVVMVAAVIVDRFKLIENGPCGMHLACFTDFFYHHAERIVGEKRTWVGRPAMRFQNDPYLLDDIARLRKLVARRPKAYTFSYTLIGLLI